MKRQRKLASFGSIKQSHCLRTLTGICLSAIAVMSTTSARADYYDYRYIGNPTTTLLAETFWADNSFYKGGFVTVDFHATKLLDADTQYFLTETPFISNIVVNFDYTGALNPGVSSTFSGYPQAALNPWSGLMTDIDGIPVAWEISKNFAPSNRDLGAVVTASYPSAPYNMFSNSFCRADMQCSGIDEFYLDEQHATFGQNMPWLEGSPPWGVGAWTITLVPEPETYAMMFVGLALIGTIVRRRQAKED